MIRSRGHDVAVLWSRRSRDAYAAEAVARGETYSFTDAWSRPRTWLKGEHAYLAPAGASVLLGRCNLKHDLIQETDLREDVLAGLRALLVPNAANSAEVLRRLQAAGPISRRPGSASPARRRGQSPATPAGAGARTRPSRARSGSRST